MMAFVSAFAPGTALIGRANGVCRQTTTKTTSTKARIVMEKSPSVPFMDVPVALDASMPGFVGFDPLNISSFLNVKWLQEAEIKHGRLCMVRNMRVCLHTHTHTHAKKLTLYYSWR